MMQNERHNRRGSVLPLTVLCLVGMCGFVGLAIDIGLIATVRTQCQSAADSAAMAGARSLNGTSGQNLGTATTTGTAMYNAVQTAVANPVLGGTMPSANVTMLFGTWHYDTTNQVFTPMFPDAEGNLPSGDNYNLCQITATYTVKVTFAAVFQAVDPSFNSVTTVTAVAQAAHRPRDTAIILDYSGSMNNESDLWNNESYLDTGATNSNRGYTWPQSSNPNYTSNNNETVYPQFGHYSNKNNYADYTSYPNLLCPAAASAGTNFFNPSSGGAPASAGLIGKSNVSVAALNVPAMVNDYYSNARGAATLTGAFTAQPTSYATTPAGDNYLSRTNGSKSYTSPAGNSYNSSVATTVNDILGKAVGNTTADNYWKDVTAGSGGYKSITGNTYNGFTVGPNYWGKTFFIWPPDPSTTAVTNYTPSGTHDWRKNFFFESDGTTPLDDNNLMFQNAFPGYLDPPGNYVINYKAILAWIKNTNGNNNVNPFPSTLRSGNVLFYSAIPTDVPASAYNHNNTNSAIGNLDQRFWKEYIDYVIGVWRDPSGNIQHPQSPSCSIGPDFVFGTVKISSNPGDGRFMDYDDNVWRPRHRLWFGPMTMIQFMSDTGLLPGTAHDISMYPMKSGVGAALQDMQNNHPNDKVAILPFNRPQYSNDPALSGTFNNPQYNLNNDYTAMVNSMWWPNLSGSDAGPWDTSTVQIPRAHGDFNANTASSYGFMLAYNQFTSASTVKTNNVGGLGRKGATKLIIFETDGMANEDSQPTGGNGGFVNNGKYNSYYAILPGQTVNGAGYNQTALLQVVEAICNKDDSTVFQPLPGGYPTPPTYPGFATSSKPVIVHCIVFGAIFESSNSAQSAAVPLMQQISIIGNTVFPTNATPTSVELAADPTTPYKWCIGTLDQRRTKIQNAILKIFDTSVPVSLIQ